MRNLCLLLLCFLALQSQAQTVTGTIVRAATLSASNSILDAGTPSGYTSKTTAGFLGDDVSNSKLPFKPLPAFSNEPYADLRRGPAHLYSDFVPDANGSGVYFYYDGTNILFRMRMGSLVPGAKGYSILIDADQKFGATGPNADPNYQAATTGTNGNPGFEIEVDLFTQNTGATGVAIYDVDGTSTPVQKKTYTNWKDYSQISIAGTSDNGDPDFFIDWYIPMADLTTYFGVTASTPLRFNATTVMAGQAAIGGPKSDIYGVNDALYKNTNAEYEAYMNAQPTTTLSNWGGTSTTSPFTGMCTVAPVITGSYNVGTATVSGTWTANTLPSSATSATIYLYKNGTLVNPGGVTVSSGGTWNVTGVTLAGSDVLTAKAQATGESMCFTSNSVTVPACTSYTPTTSGSITCSGVRGFVGTKAATTTVIKLYRFTTSGPALFATDNATTTPSGYVVGYPTTTSWDYNGINNGGQSDACNGGQPDMINGSYFITITDAGSCESAPINTTATGCIGVTATTTPTITQTNLYNGGTSISGTVGVSGSTVMLYQNGLYKGTTTASGTAWSFSGQSFLTNDVITVYAIATGTCVSATASRTVLACFTTPPIINVDANNQLAIGAPITGYASEPSGTTIKVYTSGNTLVATTTVASNGTWSTNTLYNAVASTTYYATAQNGTCTLGTSGNASTVAGTTPSARCGTITAPVVYTDASVSGTLSSSATSTIVKLYLDGTLIGQTSSLTNTTAWSVTGIASGTLYPNGILTIGIQETGNQETTCFATATVTCGSALTQPTVSPDNATINSGQTQTYTISNVVSGYFYGIADNTTGKELASGVWASSTSNFNMTTYPISSPGTVSVVVKASSITGGVLCTVTSAAKTLNVNGTLPVKLAEFKGWKDGRVNRLTWTSSTEINADKYIVERSADGRNFTVIGTVGAEGKPYSYQFTDADPLSTANYYRLRMVDRDLHTSFSHIVLLKNDGQFTALVQILPNPFQDRLQVSFTVSSAQTVRLELVDGFGRVVRSLSKNVQAGANQETLQGLGGLSSGMYLLRMYTAEGLIQEKIMR